MKNKIRLTIYFLTSTLLFVIIYSISYVNYQLSKEIAYSLGITTGLKKGAQSARNIDYKYLVNGKWYYGLGDFKESYNPKNGKYVVAYSISDPKVSLILYEKPLRYDHTEYDSIPYEVEKIPFLKRFRGYRDGFLPPIENESKLDSLQKEIEHLKSEAKLKDEIIALLKKQQS